VLVTRDTSESKIRVLVSGFEAFGGETLNPTHALVEQVLAQKIAVPENIEIRGVVLPVTFERSFAALESQIESFDPDVVLCFGQAGGRARIEFERVALNLIDADIPDNGGSQPREIKIEERGETAHLSTLPVRAWADAVSGFGIPAAVSNSAGLYVCNYLFYRLQSYLKDRSEVRSGFIHVPFLPEQAVGKSAPSLAFDQLRQALEIVLNEISKIPFRDK
jgi:pyroglutamyl-peptidase